MKLPRRNKILQTHLYVWLCLFFLLHAACSDREAYYSFYSVHRSIWHTDSVARFEVAVTDTLSMHDVFVEIRNNDKYPYQNLWLFVSFQYPTGETRQDTLECTLADDFGKWYGKGFSLYELSVPYETKLCFPASGTYTYTIRQGMRDDFLPGISDVGLKIVRVEE